MSNGEIADGNKACTRKRERSQVRKEALRFPTLMECREIEGEPATSNHNYKVSESTKQASSEPMQIAHIALTLLRYQTPIDHVVFQTKPGDSPH